MDGYERFPRERLLRPWTDPLPPTPFVAPASATTVKTIELKPGLKAILIAISPVANVTSLSVTGTGSRVVYATTALQPVTGLLLCPVIPVFDDHVDLSLTVNANGPVFVSVFGVTEQIDPPAFLGLGGADVTLGGVTAPAALADNDPNPTTYRFGAYLSLFNGAQWNRVSAASAFNANAVNLGETIVVLPAILVSGGLAVFPRTPDTFKTVGASGLGNTAVWTPAAGKKFRLMGYTIELSNNVSLLAAGINEISLNDAGSAIGRQHSVFIPAAAGTTFGPGYTTGSVMLGNGILSAAANNVLNINLSVALASGECRVNVFGTEE